MEFVCSFSRVFLVFFLFSDLSNSIISKSSVGIFLFIKSKLFPSLSRQTAAAADRRIETSLDTHAVCFFCSRAKLDLCRLYFLVFVILFIHKLDQMVSLIHINCLCLLMFIVVFVQSETLVEPSSNEINSSKTSMTNEQLYELYKIMRADPRLASVSNQEIVSYIYRNFLLANTDQSDQIKGKVFKQRHRKINPVD